MVQTAQAASIEPVFITQPVLYGDAVDPNTGIDLGDLTIGELNGELSWKVLELYNDVMREVAAKHGILLIDLAHTLEKSSLYYYDFVHYNNSGSERVAEIISQDLCPFLKEKYPEHAKAECP
jgi:hypothetical protein